MLRIITRARARRALEVVEVMKQYFEFMIVPQLLLNRFLLQETGSVQKIWTPALRHDGINSLSMGD